MAIGSPGPKPGLRKRDLLGWRFLLNRRLVVLSFENGRSTSLPGGFPNTSTIL